jgi:hypothetical protein
MANYSRSNYFEGSRSQEFSQGQTTNSSGNPSSRQDDFSPSTGMGYPPSSRSSTLTNAQLRPNLPTYMFSGVRTPGSASSRESVVASVGGTFDDPLVKNGNGSSPLTENEKIASTKSSSKMKKWIFWSILIGIVVAAAVVVPVYFFVIRPKTSDKSVQNNNTNSDSDTSATTTQASNGNPTATSSGSSSSSTPSITPNRDDPSSLGIPPSAYGTVLDSTKWLDWTDFNVTYTNATVGGLSLMVLN